MFYLPIILLLPLLINIDVNKKSKFIIYFAFFTLLTIIVGFRYGIGADYFSYKDIYSNITKTNIQRVFTDYHQIELGYVFLMLGFRRLGFSYELFVFIINMTSLVLFSIWIYDNKKDNKSYSYMLFYSMFFIVWVLSTYRQSLTISIGLYFLYNNKFNFSTVKKILIILLLSLIHKSVLILLIYLILEQLNLTEKQILSLFIIALFTNFIPVSLFKHIINWLPFSTKILHYLTTNRSILTFSSLVRIVFFCFFYLSYVLNDDEDYDFLFRFHLYGYIIYFLLKFSEITASRASVYSYISIVILFPVSIKIMLSYLDKNFARKLDFSSGLVLILSIVSFSLISMRKELVTLEKQVKYTKSFNTLNFPNLFYKNPEEFKTQFGLKELLREESNKDVKNFVDSTQQEYTYSVGDSFVSVFDVRLNKYIVINQNGQVASHRSFFYKPKVYGNLYEEVDESNIYRNMYYREIEGSNGDNKLAIIEEKLKLSDMINRQKVYVSDGDYFENDEFDKARIFLDAFELDYDVLDIAKFTQPLKYTIVRIRMENNLYYILLDEFGNLYDNKIFNSFKRFDHNGFIELETSNARYIYFQDKVLSWVEPLGGNND